MGTQGLEGAVLEHALTEDEKRRMMESIPPACGRCGKPMQNGGHVGWFCHDKACLPPPLVTVVPSIEATKVVQDLVEMRTRIQEGATRSLDLPTMVSIIPVDQGGTVYYECWLSGFGHRVKATSRSKVKAMAYALRDLAEKVLQESE